MTNQEIRDKAVAAYETQCENLKQAAIRHFQRWIPEAEYNEHEDIFILGGYEFNYEYRNETFALVGERESPIYNLADFGEYIVGLESWQEKKRIMGLGRCS